MHQTSSTMSRSGTRRWAFLGLLAAMLLLALAQAVPAMAASSLRRRPRRRSTRRRPRERPHCLRLALLQHHGAARIRCPDGDYYVKVRFTPNADGSPAGVDNRGFTWNPAPRALGPGARGLDAVPDRDGHGRSHHRRQQRRHQRVVLLQVRRHDEEPGPTACSISLSSGADGHYAQRQHRHSRHAGRSVDALRLGSTTASATTQVNGKRAVSRRPCYGASQPRRAAAHREPTSCDDDGNGVVDDEQYGPVQAGGFRMAVPTGPGTRRQAAGLDLVGGADRLHHHNARHGHRPRRD